MMFPRHIENLIADLRNLPHNHSKARLRKERPLSALIDLLTEKHAIEQPSCEKIIMKHWRDIVGSAMAHRCKPQKILHGNMLVIVTANPTLRNELALRKHEILSKIRTLPSCQGIQELFFKHG
jgi:predicted nucleic acid-binding Zn ribbon protein